MSNPSVGVVILGGGRGTRLGPLTWSRSKPAVPVAGKYRLVDVPISNALHSGMDRMIVLTQYLQHSLHRHVSSTYRFDPFSEGYIHLMGAQQTRRGERWFEGTADAVRANLDDIERLSTDLILILAGDHMYRMDYREMVREHVAADAEITVAVQPCSEADVAGFGVMRVDGGGRIVEFREKPKTAEQREGMALQPAWLAARKIPAHTPYLASMGIYLFDKKALLQGLDSGGMDFGTHLIPAAVETRHVQAHFYRGYWRDIGTVQSFFEAHMDMVAEEPPFRVDDADWPIYTHPRFLPCARVSRTSMDNTMIGDGAVVTDSQISDCVLGIRARVHGARLHRTLLLGNDADPPSAEPDVPAIGVAAGAVIENAIIDRNARIGAGARITNAERVTEAEGNGWAIMDGIVVIPKNGVIPAGAVI